METDTIVNADAIDRRSLREAIVKAYSSDSQLEVLFADVEQAIRTAGEPRQIEVNTGVVGGDTRPLKVKKLIEYLEGYGYLRYLVQVVHADRPKLDIASLAESRQRGAAGATLNAQPPKFNNLPAQTSTFIGRREEMAKLEALLMQKNPRLVTLIGPPGVGKTRLAIEVATKLVDDFEDGVCFVDLSRSPDRQTIMPRIASRLGISEGTKQNSVVEVIEQGLMSQGPLSEVLEQGLFDVVIKSLRQRQLLLILDSFEQMIESAPEVMRLLAEVRELKILVTSTKALKDLPGNQDVVQGERLFSVRPLDHAVGKYQRSVEQLKSYDAVQLFIDRALLVVEPEQLPLDDEQTWIDVGRICEQLDRLPWTIQIVAPLTRDFPVSAILKQLNDLSSRGGSRTSRILPQEAMGKALELVYEPLSANEQRLFRRLSVFVGECTPDSAKAVCNPLNDWELDITRGLFLLKGNSLLDQVRHDEEGGRFKMLSTTRHYARKQLEEKAEEGEASEVQRRYADYFLKLAESAAPELDKLRQQHWLHILDDEYENIIAVLAWAGTDDGDVQLGLRLGRAMWRYWEVRGYLTEGRKHLELILARTPESECTAIRASALNAVGRLALAQGDHSTALKAFDKAYNLAKELNDLEIMAHSRHGQATEALRRGNMGEAKQCARQSLQYYLSVGNKQGVAWALSELGTAELGMGNTSSAKKHFEQSRDLRTSLGDRQGEAGSLQKLGALAVYSADFGRAKRLFEEGLNIFQQIENKGGIAWLLESLGEVLTLMGQYNEARKHLDESLRIRMELGDKQGVVMSGLDLGRVLLRQGNYKEAEKIYNEARRIAKEIGYKVGEGWATGHLGDIKLYQDASPDYTNVVSLLLESIEVFESVERPYRKGRRWALNALGKAALLKGDIAGARNRFQQSRDLEASYEKEGTAGSLEGLACVALQEGDPAAAQSLLGQSLRLRKKLGDVYGIIEGLEYSALAHAPSAPQIATQQFGATTAAREALALPIPPVLKLKYDSVVAHCRASLSDADFTAAWQAGIRMSLDDAVNHALSSSILGSKVGE
ncbi:MAG TPA: tetratricopeptide repeat protein [Chloroflexia bacterium]|jgi:predicted ATPase